MTVRMLAAIVVSSLLAFAGMVQGVGDGIGAPAPLESPARGRGQGRDLAHPSHSAASSSPIRVGASAEDSRRAASAVRGAEDMLATRPVPSRLDRRTTIEAAYRGEATLVAALEGSGSRPFALAAADLDEDGMADLVAAYGAGEDGMLAIHRGNPDAIDVNSPGAKARRMDGTFVDSPFLPDTALVRTPERPDHLAAGDFDGDGHADLLVVADGSDSLWLLSGDGRGGFAEPVRRALPGPASAFTVGEPFRGLGPSSIAVAVVARGENPGEREAGSIDARSDGRRAAVAPGGEAGARLALFGVSAGVLDSSPTVVDLHAEAVELAWLPPSSRLDEAVAVLRADGSIHLIDLAGSAGARGSSTTPSVDPSGEVRELSMTRVELPAPAIAMRAGRFLGSTEPSLAILAADGRLRVLSRGLADPFVHDWALTDWPGERSDRAVMGDAPDAGRGLLSRGKACCADEPPTRGLEPDLDTPPDRLDLPGPGGSGPPAFAVSPAFALATARITGHGGEDLLLLDRAAGRIALVPWGESAAHALAGASSSAAPIDVLPMRLDQDGLDDLVVLVPGAPSLEVLRLSGGIPETFYVDSVADSPDAQLDGTCDDGSGQPEHCTLRAAMEEANFHPGFDQISFNVPVTTTVTIHVLSALPAVGGADNPIVIDGRTQSGYVGLPIVQITGEQAPGADGLRVMGGGSTISGLLINGFHASGGVGGTALRLSGSGTIVEKNYIGTGFGANGAISSDLGILLDGATSCTIGGNSAESRNLVSGNLAGIRLVGASLNVITANFIGIQGDSFSALGNTEEAGIVLTGASSTNVIGGTSSNLSNLIGFNGREGVRIEGSGTGNKILHNGIFSNGGMGIALGSGAAPTPNDESPGGCPADADDGPNRLQNHPVIDSVTVDENDLHIVIDGSLTSTPNTAFTIELYRSPTCDGSGSGEGKTFLTSLAGPPARTGSDCRTPPIHIDRPLIVPGGEWITATATDPQGNTSEFSPCVQVPIVMPELAISDASVTEGNVGFPNAEFHITLSKVSNQTVSVHYQTANGSATAPADYAANTGVVTFQPGETEQVLLIGVKGDTLYESDETFLVNLSDVTNAIITDGQALGTILNDDEATEPHDLALTKLTVPKKVTIKNGIPATARIMVQFQNRSLHDETINSAGDLQVIVNLFVESLGECGAPVPTQRPGFVFPRIVKSKQLYTVAFDVTFSCANTPAAGSADYRFTAEVHHSGVNGIHDTHTVDDVCPRSVDPPYVIDPYPNNKIKDKGCGARKADGTFGADVTVDIVVK